MARAGGAYALALRLDREVDIALGGVAGRLQPDWYVYAGSAYGPGGLRSRLARHFRRDKPLHWHVDRLTGTAAALGAIAIEGGAECDIVAALVRSGQFDFPLAGFGSSDCRQCPSHLLRLRLDG